MEAFNDSQQSFHNEILQSGRDKEKVIVCIILKPHILRFSKIFQLTDIMETLFIQEITLI